MSRSLAPHRLRNERRPALAGLSVLAPVAYHLLSSVLLRPDYLRMHRSTYIANTFLVLFCGAWIFRFVLLAGAQSPDSIAVRVLVELFCLGAFFVSVQLMHEGLSQQDPPSMLPLAATMGVSAVLDIGISAAYLAGVLPSVVLHELNGQAVPVSWDYALKYLWGGLLAWRYRATPAPG